MFASKVCKYYVLQTIRSITQFWSAILLTFLPSCLFSREKPWLCCFSTGSVHQQKRLQWPARWLHTWKRWKKPRPRFWRSSSTWPMTTATQCCITVCPTATTASSACSWTQVMALVWSESLQKEQLSWKHERMWIFTLHHQVWVMWTFRTTLATQQWCWPRWWPPMVQVVWRWSAR